MLGDLLLGAVRLAHALTAALWVGGTLVFAFVPRNVTDDDRRRGQVRRLRQALRIGIGVFVLTGALLSVERLGSAALPPTYFALLLLKVGIGIWMFFAARQIGVASRADADWTGSAEVRVIAAGVVVYALAMALRSIYESVVRS